MKKILFIILAGAFILRIIGINYGLPMFFVGDEASLTGGALKMLELRTFIPSLNPAEFRLLYYPPLMSYIYLIFIIPFLFFKVLVGGLSLEALKQSVILDPSAVWLISRLVTAVFGTLTVYITYLLGRKLFSELAGIFAAALVGDSFLAVQLSHFARHWVPAVFFAYLIAAFGFLIYFKPQRRTYLWAGAIAGIAFGASYVTAIAILVILLGHLLGRKEPMLRRIFSVDLVYFFLIFLAIASVFILLNVTGFQLVTGQEGSISSVSAKTVAGFLLFLKDIAVYFFWYEPVLAILGVFGLLFLYFVSRKLFLMFLLFPLGYWTALYLVFHFEPRYNVFLVPWFALLAGFLLWQLWLLPLDRRFIRTGVIAVLLVPVAISGYYDYLLLRPDTRVEAKAWIESNIPADAKMAAYLNTLKLTPGRTAVERLYRDYPYLVRSLDGALKDLPDDKYPRPAFDYINLREINKSDMARLEPDLTSQKFAYLVVERYSGEELPASMTFLMEPSAKIAEFHSQPVRKNLLDVNNNSSGSIFGLFDIKNLGPDVEIYKVSR